MGRRRKYASASPPAPIDLNPISEPVLDFPDRDLADMTPDDYARLGFICGLEVHQQLLTERKLFCRCPAGVRTREVDAEVLRHMRPTLSELGEYDGCALMEFKTKKEILYLLAHGLVCTYEMDDTPPFEIDPLAVKRALEVSAMFDMNLVSELQVMRKQYLDGSIPTGFQRTAMVALGGQIPMRESELGPDRVLRIRQLTLEEDSCREVRDYGHNIIFRTDRLGTPLIETVTEPDLVTPHDVAVGGRLIASVARASNKVRRGPGAARQDVNVSIAGSRRVEIKGVPNHRVLPRLVHNEAFRHLNLLRIRDLMHKRELTVKDFEIDDSEDAWTSNLVVDARRLLRGSAFLPIVEARAQGEMVCAVRIPRCAGLLAHRTQPGHVFLQEITERVRVIACLTPPFMISSDTHADALSSVVWQQLRSATGATRDDAIVVVWGPEDDVDTAAREILTRAADATIGVPSETRQAHDDASTGFERILPGPERMYPDTDTPPLPIPDVWLEDNAAHMAPRPWEREDRYLADGVTPALARQLASSVHAPTYEALAPKTKDAAVRVAAILVGRLRRLNTIEPERVAPLVRAVEAGTLLPEALDLAFLRVRDGEKAETVLRDFEVARDPDARLSEAVAKVEAAKKAVLTKDVEARCRWAMGLVMPDLIGRVARTTVEARVREVL
ncbi:MAG: Glu-tRNA(Gln) amidotransferase subunit GatE [Deltaproteobacteria bacterium]